MGARHAAVERVGIDLLDPHPKNKETYGETLVDSELVDAIERAGLITPPLVTPVEGGRYRIISGHRRVAACRHIGMTDIDVQIHEYESEDQELLYFYLSNSQRVKTHGMMVREIIGLMQIDLNNRAIKQDIVAQGLAEVLEPGSQNMDEAAALTTAEVASQLGFSAELVKCTRMVFGDPYRKRYLDQLVESGKVKNHKALDGFVKQWDKLRQDCLDDKVTVYAVAKELREQKSKILAGSGRNPAKTPKAPKLPPVTSFNGLDQAATFLLNEYEDRYDGIAEMTLKPEEICEMLVKYHEFMS